MQATLRPALVLFVLLSIVTGLLYPLAVTGASHVLFPWQAAGSLIDAAGQPLRDGSGAKPVGSLLIGQSFTDPKHFWSRPSATSPMSNNATGSSGSNLGPLNSALTDAVKGRVDALKAADAGNGLSVPVDLVTASASGLDPHISVAAALYQVQRVAKAHGLPAERVQQLVQEHTESRTLGLLGEPRVNVLALNLALDAQKP